MLLGFDIGGTKCAVVTAEKTPDGITITAKEKIPTDLNISPGEMIDRLIALADKVCGGKRPESIGISCGGPLDSSRGLILGPPNLPGWDCVPIALQIKTISVCRYICKMMRMPVPWLNGNSAPARVQKT